MRNTRKLLAVIFVLSILLGCLLPNSPQALADSREAQLQAKIDQIVAGIPSSAATDVSRALYLHDYIVRNVAYEMVGDHQTAYGALLDGKAVCAGYADAYLQLLTAVGIQARTITGTADNGSGDPQPHAWTMLNLDGKCLFTDVTWDDPKKCPGLDLFRVGGWSTWNGHGAGGRGADTCPSLGPVCAHL